MKLSLSLIVTFALINFTDGKVSTIKSSKTQKSSKSLYTGRCDPNNNDFPMYCPSQSDVDAFVDALNLWFSGEDRNLIAWKSLWAADEEALYCRNGQCMTGLENIANSFIPLGYQLKPPSYIAINDWKSAPGYLAFTDTTEVMTSVGDCKFDLDVPRWFYYNNDGKITQLHQSVIPYEELNNFVGGIMNGVKCSI